MSSEAIKYLKNPDVVCREELQEEWLFFNPETNQKRVSNVLGAYVWELCDGTRDLAGIVQRQPGHARGQPVHLHDAPPVAAADGGGRRLLGCVEGRETARPADAELAIALQVALALDDRVQVVPDPQQVRVVAGGDESRCEQPIGATCEPTEVPA